MFLTMQTLWRSLKPPKISPNETDIIQIPPRPRASAAASGPKGHHLDCGQHPFPLTATKTREMLAGELAVVEDDAAAAAAGEARRGA